MTVAGIKKRQAENTINHAYQTSKALKTPLGGWITAFQEAIGMSTTILAERLGISRNSIYKSIGNERSGSISLNQLAKVADAMGGELVYAIAPKDGPVEEIVMAQARMNAKRIIQRTHAHMALEEQTEGLRSQEEMIEKLATVMAREMPRGFWK